MLGVLGHIWGGPVLYKRDGVEVRERHGVRTLHLGSDTVQSAMRVDQPDELDLSYTRAMMAFLLFMPPPRRALMIGLGGGSLAKFFYHRLPETRLRVIEVSAGVVEVARTYFQVPADCGRLAISIGEGASYVTRAQERVDALFVDAYDGRSLAASLATEDFFNAARALVSPAGMLIMNLWSSDRAFGRNLRSIERAFSNRCLCLPAERPGNVIVFAFAASPPRLQWIELLEHARGLQGRFGLEFTRFVHGLKQMNRHDAKAIHMQYEDEG
jgi:spermidine synthase